MLVECLPVLYASLALSHFTVQLALAIWGRSKGLVNGFSGDERVLVIVPGYREREDSIEKTVESCVRACEGFKRATVVYVEDDRARDLGEVCSRWGDRVEFLAVGRNVGKRRAQAFAYRWYRERYGVPDFVITVDSDTLVERRAFEGLVFKDPGIGAVTGNITVRPKDNFLRRLISLRYFLAFNLERQSQSVGGQVLCCSGPLSCYRGELWNKVLEDYETQMFRGRECTFGDDRHLTNLVIREGYKTMYNHRALAYTSAPADLGTYIRQQYRWTKSFFREALVMVGYGRKLNGYTWWEISVALIMPLLLVVNIGVMAVIVAPETPFVLVRYAGIVIGMAWLRSIFGVVVDGFNRKADYFYFPAFAALSLVLLLPLKIKALFNLTDTRWGTR